MQIMNLNSGSSGSVIKSIQRGVINITPKTTFIDNTNVTLRPNVDVSKSIVLLSASFGVVYPTSVRTTSSGYTLKDAETVATLVDSTTLNIYSKGYQKDSSEVVYNFLSVAWQVIEFK